jgi:NAD(P)-dependent dehydrogenase (short-subunit alcohol dehydrogenase family)
VLDKRPAVYDIRINYGPGQARNTFRQTGDAQQHEGMITSLVDPSDVASCMAFLASDDANYARGTIFTR